MDGMKRLASTTRGRTWLHITKHAVSSPRVEASTMEYVGIDLHKVHTQICVQDADGRVLSEIRIRTLRETFEVAFENRPRARILLESSGSSEWAAVLLERLGHEVIVADPGYVVMYGTTSRRVKTDLRDARALADACRLGAFRPAHRTSPAQRRTRQRLVARDTMVKARTRLVTMCQGILRQYGIYVPTGSAECFERRLEKTTMPPDIAADLAPVMKALLAINESIAECEDTVEELAKGSEVARRLQTVPGVGPITALGFASRIDDPARFKDADQVASYFGLVPIERSSGEKRIQGHITKTGDKYVRTLMIQTAIRVMRLRHPAATPLWMWAERIATRRGKNIARVALARKLARLLFTLMKDRTVYMPEKLTPAA